MSYCGLDKSYSFIALYSVVIYLLRDTIVDDGEGGMLRKIFLEAGGDMIQRQS